MKNKVSLKSWLIWLFVDFVLIALALYGFTWAMNLYLVGFWFYIGLIALAFAYFVDLDNKRKEENRPIEAEPKVSKRDNILTGIFYTVNILFLGALGYGILTFILIIVAFLSYSFDIYMKSEWDKQQEKFKV